MTGLEEQVIAHVPTRRPSSLARLGGSVIRHPPALVSLIWLFVVGVAAIFASGLPLQSPDAQHVSALLMGPSAAHLLGTDDLGRDVLSRLVFGSRVSLLVGVSVAVISASVGGLLGLVVGYFGGAVDTLAMLFVDAIQSLPGIVLALGLIAAIGTGPFAVVIALSVSAVPAFVRVVRAEVLQSLARDYVVAAESLGASPWRVIGNHVSRDALPTFIVQASIICGIAILAEAGLGFLGVGVKLPTPTWGNMLSEAYVYTRQDPLFAIFPGAAITLTVLSLNLLGDWLRETLDPKVRRAT